MPDRVIRDELLESDRWLDLPSDTHRLVFSPILLLLCDDLGNFEGGRRLWRLLHSKTHGVKTEQDYAKLMIDLQDADLIRRYEVDGKEYFHIPRMRAHRQYLVQKCPSSPWQKDVVLGKSQRLTKQGKAKYQQVNDKCSNDMADISHACSNDVAQGVGVGSRKLETEVGVGSRKLETEVGVGDEENLYVAHPDGLPDGQKTAAPAGRTPKARQHRFDEDDRVLASKILERVREVAPSARPSLDAWANDLRLMRERDGRSLADIEAMFAWAHTDAFWRQNILSPTTLREKWPKLEAKRGGAAAAYRPDETAVMEAYNAALTPKGWPEAVTKPYCPKRAGAIMEFLGFSSAPEWMARYFRYLSHNLPAKPGFGFDWVIRRDTYIRAKEGNFRVLAAVA